MRCVDKEGELIMKRRTHALLMAILLVLTLGLAAPAQAGRAHPVPVKATVSGEHWVAPPDCDGDGAFQKWSSAGTGQMSHLGMVDYVLEQCTYMGDPFPPDYAYGEGTITFTAANGDTLVIAQQGTGELVFDGEVMTGFMGEGTWTVVEGEGTGRFANANGEGSMDFLGDIPESAAPNGIGTVFGLPDGITVLNFKGAITYNASDRSK
jgi:hypothetical protein